jgi:hypothetical protein
MFYDIIERFCLAELRKWYLTKQVLEIHTPDPIWVGVIAVGGKEIAW